MGFDQRACVFLRAGAVMTCSVGVIIDAPAARAQVMFSNQAPAAGINIIHPGTMAGFPGNSMVAGGAVGDFNNDGWPDLFVVQTGTTDRLFINNTDGTFSDQSAAWGLTEAHWGMGASVGDFNRDGHLDVFVTSVGTLASGYAPGHHRLYKNNGDGTFTNVATAAGVDFVSPAMADGFGSSFGDYDCDGDLDLFVGGWVQNSEGCRLFQNNGDETFTDVTVAAGVFNINTHGFSPRFIDMNGDLWPELLLAGDFYTSKYYVNNTDGTFTDMTAASGAGLDSNGMGQACADFDNDGVMDWYVTSIHQEIAIGREGNKLYLNSGADFFTETAALAGVDDGGWGWGTVAADVNHDGLVDILEVNGFGSHLDFINERAKVFLNAGGGVFTEIAQQAGFEHTLSGRGLVSLDYDRDGDLDFVAFSWGGELQLWRNDNGASLGDWLIVEIDTGPASNLAPNGIGAKLTLTAAGVIHSRFVDSGCSYLSTSELIAHFGLGPAASIDELRFDFPDGSTVIKTNLAPNQRLVITYAGIGDINTDGVIASADAAMLLGTWGALGGVTDLNSDGFVGAADLAILLARWTLTP